jgi:autotransporter-associated beta strand protein
MSFYWDTNGSGNGIDGGNGSWSTSVANWNVNQDGAGDNTVWINGDSSEANFTQGGGGVLTVTGTITAGLIVGGSVTLIGTGKLFIKSVSNCNLVSDIPITSSSDTIFGFQSLINSSLSFNKGFTCNAFSLGVPTIISGTLENTSTTIGNSISDSLTLNCTANITGTTLIESGGSLIITSNNTASFNSLFDTYANDITSNGLLNLNDSVQISGVPTFKGTGTTAIYSDITGDYNLIKAGSGTLFLSGSKNSLNTRDIKVNEGTFKVKPDTTFNSSNFICSGTLNFIGNANIFGNVTFATGTLRLGI